ncbi:MAG: hypothetical protein ACREUX_17720, partial [Burkholderiales bacterium]
MPVAFERRLDERIVVRTCEQCVQLQRKLERFAAAEFAATRAEGEFVRGGIGDTDQAQQRRGPDAD